MEKKAILVVSAGTSEETTGLRAVRRVEEAVAKAFPKWEVCRCFVSETALRQLAAKGIPTEKPEQTLKRLHREGVTRILVLPTFLTPGKMYRDLMAGLEPWREAFAMLISAGPLLASQKGTLALAEILAWEFQPKEKEALLLMGHGTGGEEDRGYRQLEQALRNAGAKHSHVALLRGGPGVDEKLREIRERGYTGVLLAPLMLSAGVHGIRNMAGETPESWKNRCLAAGLKTRCCLMGLGDREKVGKLYVKQLEELVFAENNGVCIVQDS